MHMWGSKTGKDGEPRSSALSGCDSGDIAVLLTGEHLDTNLIFMSCYLAKGARRTLHFIHYITVPRTLPIKAVLAKEMEAADALLSRAMQVATTIGCTAIAEILQARSIGHAIADEAKDRHLALLLIGVTQQKAPDGLNEAIGHILTISPCRIWLLQDPIVSR